MRHIKFLFLGLSITAMLSGCATTPRATATLSSELGGMIRSARESHLNLVDEYIRQRRARLDDFMQQEWIPRYMANFAKEAKFTETYDAEKDPIEKGKIMAEFQEQASKDIAAQRAEMVNALDQVERLLRNHITAHYDQMMIVNQSITAHLLSAAKVTEARAEMEKTLNLPIDKLVPLEKFDSIFRRIERFEGKAAGKAAELNQLVNEAKTILIQEVTK